MLEYHRFKVVHDLFLKGREEEAREELAALQRRYVALCDENLTFKMQAQEYEDILYLARNLIFDGEFYWLVTGSIRQGPFCPSCYNRDGLLMRLSGEPDLRHCAQCREEFRSKERLHHVGVPAVAAAVPNEPESGTYHPPLYEERRAKVIPFHR